MMAILPNEIMTLTILLGVIMVLVAGDASLMKMNRTSTTASPMVQPSAISTKTTTKPTTTTLAPPPFAAVMDIFQAPLEAFKTKRASQQEEKAQLPMSRDQGDVAATPGQPISNIFLNAGQGLGNAASSLTGWFNNRMIPMALRAPSSTTKAPQIIIRVPNQQAMRKPSTAAQNKRKPQAHRNKPVIVDTADDIEGYEDVGEDDEENFNPNHDQIEDDNADEDQDEDKNQDEYDEYKPLKTKKGSRQTKKQPNLEYFYIEENQGGDDFDYDLPLPVRKTQYQQQQNLNNRRRKNPSNKNKQQQNGQNQKRRKPVRKNQNAPAVQFVQNGPSNTQVKRQRRPAASFELIPISQSQANNYIQKRKPSSTAQNTQKRPSFINIPWSRLGFSGPPKETTSKPIIVQIPNQNLNNQRRPARKPTNLESKPKRKPLRGQLQNQSPVFSLLSENEIRDLFESQEIQPPKKTQISNLNLGGKKKPPMEADDDDDDADADDVETDDNPQAEPQLENYEKDTGSYIVVGPADDDTETEVDHSKHRGFQRGRFSQRSRQRMDTEDYYE